jgi:hypothetical protein
MTTKTKIETPTYDNKTPYAIGYARPNSWGDGAELHLKLCRLFAARYFSESLQLEATCYVSRDYSTVYGIRLVSDDSGRFELDKLDTMAKGMAKIHKRLSAMDSELGYIKGPDAYPEFCRRVCIAAGIEHAYIEHDYNSGNTDRWGNKLSGSFDLRCFDPKKQGARFLSAMQDLTDATIKARGKQPDPAAALED